MRKLIWYFLMTSAWGQSSQTPPTVRDAYVRSGNPRVASLRDDLDVVVCKTEYDAWQKDQKPVPALFLYMNRARMKGLEAARPMPAMRSDAVITKVEGDCAARDDVFKTAKKDAEEKATAAKDAVDKVAAESDLLKKPEALKEASEKKILADNAATKRDATKAAAEQIYVLQYYLDSEFIAQPENKEPWVRLFEQWSVRDVNSSVDVSVGPADGSPWPSLAEIRFERVHWSFLVGWAVFFALIGLGFWYLNQHYDIIRDAGELVLPAGAPPQRKAYSLARTQMALWTLLVAAALVFIFAVTWNENTLSPGIVVLIGISFGTTLLSAVAEGAPKPRATKGFWADLVSDDDGPSFHRCQMVLFTVILSVIFVVKVVMNLVMPEFSPNLLSLMGISSGTYLGFKLQGK